ncbi:MAG: DUF1015 domain-containing protein [Actinomycetia bacterium]|nr:DUF1015 domain-containing protein [Actinomycetes bacterium]MCP5034582.1 DUF1015 domain-containing protein [Actinomycetes bacterium]
MAPLSLRLIDPAWTSRVPAPAHDALTPAQRRRFIAEYPDTYLTVTRSPEDLQADEFWDAKVALDHSRAALERLISQGAFGAPADPCFYLYRLSDPDHSQIGIVAGVATDDYDLGVIRVHEQVRPSRVEHLKEQTAGVKVQSSPIALAHRPNLTIESLLVSWMAAVEPLVDFTSLDGVRQQVWAVAPETGRLLQEALADEPLYLIDGHHRAAATSRLRAEAGGRANDWMLCAIFSSTDLRNEAFHRRLPGTDGEAMVEAVSEHFAIRPANDLAEVLARADDELALVTRNESGGDQWYLVGLPPAGHGAGVTSGDVPPDAAEIVGGLETVRLQHHVLEPLLGVDAGDVASRVEFSHGLADHDDLAQLGAEETDPVWVMRPVPLETVMDASDVGATMPPKSTYFQPKVRSGVFLRSLD